MVFLRFCLELVTRTEWLSQEKIVGKIGKGGNNISEKMGKDGEKDSCAAGVRRRGRHFGRRKRENWKF